MLVTFMCGFQLSAKTISTGYFVSQLMKSRYLEQHRKKKIINLNEMTPTHKPEAVFIQIGDVTYGSIHRDPFVINSFQ